MQPKEKKGRTSTHLKQEAREMGENVRGKVGGCQSVLSHQDETAARGDCRGVTLGGESVDGLCGFKLRD